MALYLDLYHGRKTADENMENGWGFNGPLIGPLENIHMTYLHTFRVFFKAANRCGFERSDDNWINLQEDMILFQGNYYGDWSMSDLTAAQATKMRKEKDRINAISYKKYLKSSDDADVVG